MKLSSIKLELRELVTETEKPQGDLARHQFEWAEWDAQGRPNGPPHWLIDKEDESGGRSISLNSPTLRPTTNSLIALSAALFSIGKFRLNLEGVIST